jgi:hypothetical protein
MEPEIFSCSSVFALRIWSAVRRHRAHRGRAASTGRSRAKRRQNGARARERGTGRTAAPALENVLKPKLDIAR